jgi:hypothetical protein
MQLSGVRTWRFHDIKLMGRGQPFGMTFDNFEAATRTAFEVTDLDFQGFLESPAQVVDGVIEALSDQDPSVCIVRLDCQDATQWEIATDSLVVVKSLEKAGFQRASASS